MKTKKILLSCLALLMLALPFGALANNKNEQKTIVISNNEIVPYNFVATASMIDFSGVAQKDVVVFGKDININGPVHGDVIAVGRNIKINGDVDGNVRVAGAMIEINGKVGKNVTVAGAEIVFGERSEVVWDVMGVAGNLLLRGKVNGNINVAGEKMVLAGETGGNISAYINNIDVASSTQVNGQLKYWSNQELTISNKENIVGGTQFISLFDKNKKQDNKFIVWNIFGIVVSMASALIVGLVIIYLFKNQISQINQRITEHSWKTLGWGAVFLFVTPIVSFIFMFFVVPIPLILLVMGFYVAMLYLAKIFFAIFIGQQLLKHKQKLDKKKVEKKEEEKVVKENLSQALIYGTVLYTLVVQIPVIGFFLWLVSVLFIFGAVGKMMGEWMEAKGKN